MGIIETAVCIAIGWFGHKYKATIINGVKDLIKK